MNPEKKFLCLNLVGTETEHEHAAVLFPELFPLNGVVCSRREDFIEVLRHHAQVDPILASWFLFCGHKKQVNFQEFQIQYQ